jgi:ATP-binding cassette, subfamily F, member 3
MEAGQPVFRREPHFSLDRRGHVRMLFRLEGVGREFAGKWLFAGVTVQCNPGDRIGLIGRNGCGKTTLLDLIEGCQTPDAGQVYRSNSIRISRVSQIPELAVQGSVREEALRVFDDLRAMEMRMHELESEMARLSDAVPEGLAAEYEKLRLRFRLDGGYDFAARTEGVLLGLGFPKEMLDAPVSHLSGGQQSRLLLAEALLRSGDLLLLDEPTNHLDIQGILWLTEFLRESKTSFLVISHDRQVLDKVTSRIWEMEAGALFDYPGNFTRARRLKEERLELELKQYERQQEWKAKTEDYIRRNMAGQKTKQAQSRLKQLERTDWRARPTHDSRQIRVTIAEAGRGGSLSLRIAWGAIGYPASRPLIEDVNLTVRRGERVAIVGGNGTGKTTLLRTLMGEVPLLAGEIEWGANNQPAYFAQSQAPDDPGATVYDRLRELDMFCSDLEIRSLAARFLFQEEDVFKTVGQLSGGERSRLALARLFFHPSNVLLMDEPTNHLDIQSREALEEALASYEGTLIVISHDLYFLKKVVEGFFLIKERTLLPANSVEELERLIEQGSMAPFQAPVRREERVERVPKTPDRATPARLSKNERQRRERRIHQIESRIHEIEQAQKTIVEELQGNYDDFMRLHELSERHEGLEVELAELYQEWETLLSELAGL